MYGLFLFRINLDVIHSESSSNIKKLLELERKLSSSIEEVKAQYGTAIQVGVTQLLHLCWKEGTSVLKRFSKDITIAQGMHRGLFSCPCYFSHQSGTHFFYLHLRFWTPRSAGAGTNWQELIQSCGPHSRVLSCQAINIWMDFRLSVLVTWATAASMKLADSFRISILISSRIA